MPSPSDKFPMHTPRIAVLYRSQSQSGARNLAGPKLVIVLFVLDPLFGPMVMGHYNIDQDSDCEVVSMAVSSTHDPVILYRWYDHSDGAIDYAFTKYRNTEVAGRQHTSGKSEPWNRGSTQMADFYIQNQAIYVYPTTFQLPQWRMHRVPGHGYPIRFIDTALPDTIDEFQRQSFGRTFATKHNHLVSDPQLESGDPTCFNTVLQLAISREEPDEDDRLSYRQGAFILKASEITSHCTPFDLDRYHTELDYSYVARLTSLPEFDNLSTLGLRIAISPLSTRIAIASWRTVKIWAIEPNAFLDRDVGGHYDVPGDYAYRADCGWTYYRSNEIDLEDEIVLIEPVELPKAGVVHELQFCGEDELWGWTEMGVCRWRFGIGVEGLREVVMCEGDGGQSCGNGVGFSAGADGPVLASDGEDEDDGDEEKVGVNRDMDTDMKTKKQTQTEPEFLKPN